MTSKTVSQAPNIIPYRYILPKDFVCPSPAYRAESMLQTRPINESDYILSSHFSHRGDVLVDSGGFVFYEIDNMRGRVRPDVYVAFEVDEEAIRTRDGYVVAEAGKPPDFALEVASKSTHNVDTDTKPTTYSRMGVSEYWRFDSTGGDYYGYALAGDILVNGVYQPIPLTTEPGGEVWGYSPILDLCLCARHPEAIKRLRFYDRKTGLYLRNFEEEQAALREAETAFLREQAARSEAEAELERLRAENRRLRGG